MKTGKDGVKSECKSCTKTRSSMWANANRDKVRASNRKFKANNPEKVKAGNQKWYRENFDRISAVNKAWRENNPERVKEMREDWTNQNPHYYTITGRIRKEHIDKNCQPKWVDENHLESIKEIYKTSKALTKFLGVQFHVDHIEPLKGKINGKHVSCGLHVFWNLRAIPESENLYKSNKLIVD